MIRVAVWFGLLQRDRRGADLRGPQVWRREFMVMNWHFPWMVPLFTVALFVCVGLGASPLVLVRGCHSFQRQSLPDWGSLRRMVPWPRSPGSRGRRS